MAVQDAVLLGNSRLVTGTVLHMMHYHGNRNVVCTLEQLTELSKAEVMPGMKPLIQKS